MDPVRVHGIGLIPRVLTLARADVSGARGGRRRIAEAPELPGLLRRERRAERALGIVSVLEIGRVPAPAGSERALRERRVETPAIVRGRLLEIEREPALRGDRVARGEGHRARPVVDHVVLIRAALLLRSVQPYRLRSRDHSRGDLPLDARDQLVGALRSFRPLDLQRAALPLGARGRDVPCGIQDLGLAAHALKLARDARELAGARFQPKVPHRHLALGRSDGEEQTVQIL